MERKHLRELNTKQKREKDRGIADQKGDWSPFTSEGGALRQAEDIINCRGEESAGERSKVNRRLEGEKRCTTGDEGD